MDDKALEEIFRDAEETLRTAESGLRDLLAAKPERRVPGLRNLMVFGGAFSRLLENLCRHDPGFEDWYRQSASAMADDPMIRNFDLLRAEILQEHKLEINVTQLRLPSAGGSFGGRPKNARAFFTGDRLGGTGWEVVLPDGSVEKYYVALSERIQPRAFPFSGGDSKKSSDNNVEALSKKYLVHLKELFRNAREYFEQ